MNARTKAVSRVLVRAYGRDFDTDDIAGRALKNADRILFNDSAVERVAKRVFPTYWDETWYHEHTEALGRQMQESQAECIAHVREIIAALREDG